MNTILDNNSDKTEDVRRIAKEIQILADADWIEWGESDFSRHLLEEI
ncbi:hypothetical protein [Pleurocapsa sp. PCC 7319]|nr:hypothetical protein [Pleurocapsa sp. PCC 7319]